MGVARLSEPAGQGLIADDLVRAVAVHDECAVVISETGGGAAATLDRVQDELSCRRVRCVRVSAPLLGSLSLRGFMAQILGSSEFCALTDGELEAGFTALTEPGAGYDRVALLVDGTHNLQLPALRYIQLACQSSPRLRVVLAGPPALDSLLIRNEFGPLHQQVRHRFELAGSPLAGLTTKPAPDGRERRAPPRWLTSLNTGLGALASSALIVSLALWVLPTGHSPDSPAPPPPAPAGDASDRVASALETPTAPLVTWTKRLTDASDPAEASASAADPVPAAAHGATPPVAVSDAAPAEPPSVPDQPPRLAPLPAGPVPEIRVADLESEPASLRRIEPAVTVDHPQDPAASGLAAPGRSPAQPPPQPVRHIAAALKQATAPDESEEGRRCRNIVLDAQLGRTPSHADTLFLQNGCRTK